MAISEKLKCLLRANKLGSRRITQERTSVLSKDLVLQGDIFGDGEIYLDGGINGNVSCEQLIIGRDGYINGKVKCKEAEIHGKVVGAISATDVVLAKTAKVIGDVSHKTLSIQPGAVIDGFCRQYDLNVSSKGTTTKSSAGEVLGRVRTGRPKQKRLKKSIDNPLSTSTGKANGYSKRTVH
ncbi:MAG: polymer-forming cytoskeletal protein [Pseudomonadota bacterium]|nr:polymer-forming cytoskeletal protein [Pseudomonadota bacterium]